MGWESLMTVVNCDKAIQNGIYFDLETQRNMSILSTIITLPFIVLASIPLILFSLVTIPLAITGLLLRVLIVYLELGIALLRGYLFFFPDDSFSYPGASSTSFLTFSAVTTPGAGLPISKGSNTGDAKSDDYFGKIQRVWPSFNSSLSRS